MAQFDYPEVRNHAALTLRARSFAPPEERLRSG